MSTPTFNLPTGYASIHWSIPAAFAESATMIGVAVIKSLKYSNQLERIKIEGNTGFVAGFTDMKASSAGGGGTKFDTEKLTLSCLHGEHASKTWPVVGESITIASLTGDNTKMNGEWWVISENSDFARKTEGEKGYDLERYCDINP